MASHLTCPWISSVRNSGPRPPTRSSPGPSRGLPRICHLPLTSTTPPPPLHPSPPFSHPPSLSTSQRPRRRNSEEKPCRSYFSAAKRLFAVRSRFGLFSLLTFHQASSDLGEKRDRSGLVRGYKRSSNIMGASRKVWWPLNYWSGI